MKNFFKTHKKQCMIGGIAFLVIFFLILIWLFIVPVFSNNKYGDRLDGIKDHKISSDTVKDIENSLKENDKVTDVTYNNEGRILDFILTVSNDMSTEDAKKLGDTILDKISDDDKKYYDIQILIDTEEENDNYPIAGYKHKSEDNFTYGNEVGSSE
ncbi:putative uncharacterized protein [Firmicutes bacterium CAG:822]|nr:putative uncharacterized protein [Firmicutes bacterium CAG:822]